MQRKQTSLKTENKSCYVLSCRIQGKSTFFYNNQTYHVHRGDLLFIPKGATYLQECEAEEIVVFHLEIFGNPPGELRLFTPQKPDELCSLFVQAALHWKEKTPSAYYHCMASLYEILACSNVLDTPAFDTVCRDPSYPIIAPSVRYLKAHLYDTDLSLDTVYKQSYISQTTFIHHFRMLYGCSPMKYINRMRIQKAQELLQSSLYTREEIALLCGFENVKHFYVVFKNITGVTTGEFLKKEKNTARSFSDQGSAFI